MSDRYQFYFDQLVEETELNAAFDKLELADRNLIADLGLFGVFSGLTVTQAAIPNMTMLVGAGTAYDSSGQRIRIASQQQVDFSQDENGQATAVSATGKTRVLSIFASFRRDPQDPKVDGHSNTIYWQQPESFRLHVVAGAEATNPATPVPPPLNSGRVLLGDIILAYGQTALQTVDFDTSRRQWAIETTSGTEIAVGTVKEAIQLLADAIGALVGIADDVGPDDGATRVGNDAISGTTYNVARGTVKTALVALFAAVNAEAAARLALDADLDAHVADAVGAHAASAISYAGGPDWLGSGDISNAGTDNDTVEKILDNIITKLTAAGGAGKLGAAALAGTPDSLTAGSIQQLLAQLLVLVNARATTTTVNSQIAAVSAALAASTGTTLVGGAAKSGSPFALTAGTLKAQLEELLDHVNAARPDTVSPTAVTITQAGWPTDSTLTYAKDNGDWGHVLGRVKNGTGGASGGGPFIVLGTLPAGVRPTKEVWTIGVEINGFDLPSGNKCVLSIGTDGAVKLWDSVQNGYVLTADFPTYKCA